HALRHAVSRAGIEDGEVEDVVIGTVLTGGTAGLNIARHAALAAGLPVTAAAQTVDRQCASGLMAIAIAAKQVMVDGMSIVAAGGQENVSACQAPFFEWALAQSDDNVILNPNFLLGKSISD
ncbi:MAG: acetyl-CoA C-acyltransferase, partial [Rhodoplanes sp.]